MTSQIAKPAAGGGARASRDEECRAAGRDNQKHNYSPQNCNPFVNPLGYLLEDYYACAGPAVRYAQSHRIEMDTTLAHAGSIGAARCAFDGWGHFVFDGEGERAIVIEVFGEDDETAIDLLAWPVERPEGFATALGAAPVLGAARIINPATWAFGGMLRIYRTPLAWLQAGCEGAVILDHRTAPLVLADCLGPIEAGSAARQAELRQLLSRPFVDRRNIVVAPQDGKLDLARAAG